MVDCLILAGGLGTRLRPAVKNVPKPMADINGQPFLHWQLEYLARQGIERVVLSVGYMSEKITSHFGPRYLNMEIEYEEEDTPLGTGGAIINALKTIQTNDFIRIECVNHVARVVVSNGNAVKNIFQNGIMIN